jgi:hypothetical protein
MSQLSRQEYNRNYRLKNKDKIKNYKKAWHLKNPGKTYEYTKKFRAKCGETLTERRRLEKRLERARHPDRQAAHYAVQFSGDIQNWYCCMNCGAEDKLEEHHPDYSKPLETFTLCQKCHKKIHRELRKKDVKQP